MDETILQLRARKETFDRFVKSQGFEEMRKEAAVMKTQWRQTPVNEKDQFHYLKACIEKEARQDAIDQFFLRMEYLAGLRDENGNKI